MVDFVFSSRKQYESAIKNFHANINNTGKNGKEARISFRNLTRNRKYNESNYSRRLDQGKSYSKKEIRHDFSVARKRAESNLKKDWLDAKKEGKTSVSFKKFKEINSEPDYKEIMESFNSPT